MGDEKFMSEGDNLKSLVGLMKDEERTVWNKCKHLSKTSAFVDRLWAVVHNSVRVKGKVVPVIRDWIKVIGISVNHETGFIMDITSTTGETMSVGHVPRQLFGYPICISMPAANLIKWDAQNRPSGDIVRSLSFAVLLMLQNDPKFRSVGSHVAVSPAQLKRLYPANDYTIIDDTRGGFSNVGGN